MNAFRSLAVLLAPAAILLVKPAGAAEASSVYSTFELKTCKVLSRDRETGGVIQRCNGSGGFQIFVAEDDLRFFVGFGPNGRKQRAFEQTLSPFNSINQTVEFRLRPDNKHPFAAILRYRTAGEDGRETGQVLVVTKIQGNQACHMAYIDARANPNPNEIARQAADSMFASFDCGKDEPKTVGATGKSNM
jgi:hypothetical protein